MMEDYKGSATSFFSPLPSSVLRLAFTLNQMSSCREMASGMNGGKHDPAVRSWEGTFFLHSCTVLFKKQGKGWTWEWFSVWWVNSGGTICVITLHQPKVQYFSCHRCNVTEYILAITCKVLRWIYFTLSISLFIFPPVGYILLFKYLIVFIILHFVQTFALFLCNDLN